MNKKIALSAIALFAVTMGLGVLNPAMATKPVDGEHKIQICHASEAKNIFNATGDGMWHNSTAGWVVIDVDEQGQMNGHWDKKTGEPRHTNGTHFDFIINATAIPADLDGLDDCTPEPVVTIG